jgi:hypothetical protein
MIPRRIRDARSIPFTQTLTEDRSHPVVSRIRSGLGFEQVLVLAVVVAAAVSRFCWLDLMEFKADEAEASRLALHALGFTEPGVGRFFPTEGLTSSVGVPNPPLFVYIVALPMAIVRSPIAAAALIAATNVFAVWLCYLVGCRYYSRFTGVAAAALFALSPWSIIFSRKIWAQDLLPLITTLFLLELHALVVRRRPIAIFWLVVIVTVATQLHFSAWVLLPILVAAAVIARDAFSLRWFALGLAVATTFYAPFLIEHWHDVSQSVTHRSPSPVSPGLRFLHTVHVLAAIVGGDTLSSLLGSQSRLAIPLTAVLFPAACIGLVIGIRGGTRRVVQARALLVVWFCLPVVALTILRTEAYIQYFIVLLPLPFFGIALAVEAATRSRPHLAAGVIAAIIAGFLVLDVGFFRTVIQNQGAPGEYGSGYRFTQAAAHAIAQESRGKPYVIAANGDLIRDPQFNAIRFLVWNADPNRVVPQGKPELGFVVLDRVPTPASLEQDRRWRFGPLELIELPKPGKHTK